MTRKELADVADDIIGAAQVLERAAKQLKEHATVLRRYGVHESCTAESWRMHRRCEIANAAKNAYAALGVSE